MKRKMTPRSLEVLKMVREHVRKHRMPPTLDEIGKAMGMSRSAVKLHIDRLVEAGEVMRIPRSPRGLMVASNR